MSVLVADIEANGLYNDVTKIHCICIKEKNNDRIMSYYNGGINHPSHSGSIRDGVDRLRNADVVIGHNWIDYDCRVIKKLYPDFKININKIRDTLVRAYLFNPHRKKHPNCPVSKTTEAGRKPIGIYSLENLGYFVGEGKIEHEEWSVFSKEMLDRCIQDVIITDKVDDMLQAEAGNWDWSKAENIEKWFRFIISEQEAHGWHIDQLHLEDCIDKLDSMIDDLDSKILPRVPLNIIKTEKESIGLTKSGSVSANAKKYLGEYVDVAGNYCKVRFEQINLDSDKQVKEYLYSLGWIPTEFNFKKDKKGKVLKDDNGNFVVSSGKITEDSLSSIEGTDVGKLISTRIQCSHRRSFVKGLQSRIRSDGRIGGGGVTCATNTGRMAHRDIVNIPKANDKVFFGKECRQIFSSPQGRCIIGADLSSLENRVAGHYTFPFDKGEYANLVLEGDCHQSTADKLGIDRDSAKTITYAIMYGAQWQKIKSILKCSDHRAKVLYNEWWEANPSLLRLKNKLERLLMNQGEDKRRGLSGRAYIKGIDGRKIYVRSWHSAMNALFQCTGSVVNKVATIMIYKKIKKYGLDAHFVVNYHDEVALESCIDKDVTDKVKEIVLESFSNAGKYLELRVPITGDARVGKSWAEVH